MCRAVALHAGRDQETASLGVLLLGHVRAAFAEATTDRLSTTELLQLLVANEEGPWGRWWGSELGRDGAPRAAAADLAAKLRPFGVKPRTIRVGDGTPRGYLLADFAEAFGPYLPRGDATPATNATRLASNVASVASVAGGSDNVAQVPVSETCSECGAQSDEPGYWGHAMQCPRVHRWSERSRASGKAI